MKFNLSINDSIFNYDKSDFSNVKNPFYYIYSKYYKSTKDCNSLDELNQKLFSNTKNNTLFYTGLEDKAKDICERCKEKLEQYLFWFSKICNNQGIIIAVPKYVKICLNNRDNNKAKRLLCILYSFNIEANNSDILHYDILFPIIYDNFH